MSQFNLDDFKVAKVDESGGDGYYYYLYLKTKDHQLSDTNTFYILRSTAAGTEFKYSFSIANPDTIWTTRTSVTYKDLSSW